MSDPYMILGVARNADEGEIRQRYLELVRQFSPDRAPERFALIHAAYDEVRDPARGLESQLFHSESDDSLDAIAADIRARLSGAQAAGRSSPCSCRPVMMDTPDIDEETMLSRFRQWLQMARDQAEEQDQELSTLEEQGDRTGLYRLVEEFTALRHELKLQTKSSRGLQEQTEAALPVLRQAIEQFRSVAPREMQASWTSGKPLAEALADLDEALDRGHSEIEKARRRLIDEPATELTAALDALYARQSWLGRLRARAYQDQVFALVKIVGPESRRPLFNALLEGYGLIRSRLNRTMNAEQIEPIFCVGLPVDPDQMIVVEVVDDPDLEPGLVIEEVRRGYLWQGRMLRYAEVRVSRSPASASDEETEVVDS